MRGILFSMLSLFVSLCWSSRGRQRATETPGSHKSPNYCTSHTHHLHITLCGTQSLGQEIKREALWLVKNWKWSPLIDQELKMEPSDWSRHHASHCTAHPPRQLQLSRKCRSGFTRTWDTLIFWAAYLSHCIVDWKWFYQVFLEVHKGLTWDVTRRGDGSGGEGKESQLKLKHDAMRTIS